MKYKNYREHWLSLQPLHGNDKTIDRGSIFTLCPPWSITKRNDWCEKPYLTVSPIEDINTIQPMVYPLNSSVFKLFNKIKDEKNWFKKLCEHDLDYYCEEDYAQCKKCKRRITTHPNNPSDKGSSGCYIVNTYADEALEFRSQFGNPSP